MKEKVLIYLRQESFFSLCMLEILHSKEQMKVILTISLLLIRILINFGNIINEEENQVFFQILLNLYLYIWLQLIQKIDQTSYK